ncbi:MAG: S41 family peptidase [Nitrospinae bacterium]|nr:S41 family peptidase [Nitrospinota bacterium]
MTQNKKTTPSLFNRFWKSTAYVAVAAFIAGSLFGLFVSARSQAIAATNSSYEHLRVFAEVMTLIQNYYVEEKSPKELTEGAVKGLLRTLDPHSAYMDKEGYESRKQETEGKFGGLGIEITVKDGYIAIITPMEDTPAEKAGLKPGDKIVKIDGVITKDMDLMEAVKKMRGEAGTKVTLTIFRDENGRVPFDVELTRAVIKVHSVKSEMMDGETGYLRILTFSMNTSDEVEAAIKKFKEKNLKSLVLDLRNNPGGLLKEAVEVGELFLKDGTVVVSTRGRSAEQNSVYHSHNRAPYLDFPIVVLINAGSASASEIVAGALKDTHRAILVGNRSFGKGSVQTVRELSNGAGLTLTTARYFTPAGTMIHGVGVSPDIEVKLKIAGKEDDGPEPLREKDLMEHFQGLKDSRTDDKPKKEPAKDPAKETKDTTPIGPRKVFDLERDNQLQRAVEVLKEWNLFQNMLSEKKAG